MNYKNIVVLFIFSLIFWYGMYNAVGNWIWLIMLLCGMSLIGLFYKLLDKK